MTTRWTRLYAALGDAPGPLSFDQVKRDIDAEVPESDELDWKKGLPGDSGLDEFAKDVAAMANAAGGFLVYGVAAHFVALSTRPAGKSLEEVRTATGSNSCAKTNGPSRQLTTKPVVG